MAPKDTRTAARKAPKKRGKKVAKRKVAKKTTATKKVTKRKRPKRLEGRPTRLRYDRDGNVTGIYVPLKYQTKAEQKKAAKSMVAACSAGAFRQAVSPGRTCGYRALKRGSKAGQGLAYARWGFPKGWPNVRFKNPGYGVAGLIVKTFKDDDGDWGYSVLTPSGDLLSVSSGEPSEQVAAREGKAEALYQAESLEVEARPNPRSKGTKLWEYNAITGYWKVARTIENEADAKAWLRVFQKDEPGKNFKISKTRPSKRPNPMGSKMPKLTKRESVILDVSQDLQRASSTLSGTDGRTEITSQTQRAAYSAAMSARNKLEKAGIRDKDLQDRAKKIMDLASLPNAAVKLYYKMVRSKNKQRARVTKANVHQAEILLDYGFAKETGRGKVRYITVPWASNPRPRKATERKVAKKAPKRRATGVRSLVAKALK